MKRIKQIIEALKVISDQPSVTIGNAYQHIIADAEGVDEDDQTSTVEERTLVGRFIREIVAIAEDMEKSPKVATEAPK